MSNEEPVIETTDETLDGDKTPEENEDPLADIPDEDEEIKEEPKKEEKSSKEIQKAKYREKWQVERDKRVELERKLAEKEQPPKADDDREKAAKDYIKRTAREAFEDLQKERVREEEQAVEEFQEELETVLDAHSEITEGKLLDVIEEFQDEFSGMRTKDILAASVKIIQSRGSSGRKPSLPQSKRGSGAVSGEKKSTDDSGKSMWQVAQEVIKDFRNK